MAECPRAAFFEYYARNEPESNDAWRVKELTTVPMLMGDTVDYIIARTLMALREDGEVKTDLADAGRRLFKRRLAASSEIADGIKTRARTKDEREASLYRPIHQHFYGMPITEHEVESAEEAAAHCLNVFEASQVWEKLRSVGPKNWGPITKLQKSVPFFSLHGERVYAAFDLFIRDGDDFVVLDWKAGSSGEIAVAGAATQLGVYALYGLSKNRPVDTIRTQAVWLRCDANYDPQPVDPLHLDAVKEKIGKEMEAEKARLTVNTYKNGRTEFVAARDDFPPRLCPRRCPMCKYRIVCKDSAEVCN